MRLPITIISILFAVICFGQNDTIHFPKDSLKAIGEYSNKKKNGHWKWFFWNGQIQSQGNYYNDIPVGKWYNWFRDGRKQAVVNYDSLGRKHGQLTEYYYRLSETHELEYKHGILNGKAQWRHFDGNIIIEGDFTDNKRTGEWKWFWPNEELQAYGTMVDSTFHGMWNYYHDDGTKDCVGEFNTGKRTATWKFYWKGSENLKKEGIYENDLMLGKWKYYDENGTPLREEEYINGIKQ